MARVRKSQHHRASPAAASSSYREAQQSSPFDFPLASQPLRRTEDDKLIVSLDFGTTFSAIAFARVPKDNTLPMPDQIHNVRSWDCGGVTYRGNEVPSVLAYQNRGRADERMYWGFGVHAAIKNQEIHQDDDDREELIRLGQIKRMKLALSSSEATKVLRRDIQESLSKLGPTRQSVEDLIADFLKELWKSVKSQAVSVYSDAVKHMPVECVVCIPAMWTQAEEQRMRKAIELAGLPPPHFVGEPEAAAVSMLAREAASIIGYSGSDQFPDVDGRGTRLHVSRAASSV